MQGEHSATAGEKAQKKTKKKTKMKKKSRWDKMCTLLHCLVAKRKRNRALMFHTKINIIFF